jgi:hypothetical protein
MHVSNLAALSQLVHTGNHGRARVTVQQKDLEPCMRPAPTYCQLSLLKRGYKEG